MEILSRMIGIYSTIFLVILWWKGTLVRELISHLSVQLLILPRINLITFYKDPPNTIASHQANAAMEFPKDGTGQAKETPLIVPNQ